MTTPPEFDGPRLLRRDEEAAAHRLFQVCFTDIAEPPAAEEAAPAEARYESQGETYGFASQGRPVSMISIFHERLRTYDGLIRVGNIGGVCTHPEFRGHRLASRLLAHCTQRLVEGGARLLLISGGRDLYTRAGCTPAGRYAAFRLRAGPELPLDPAVTLRPLQKTDALAGSRLYQAGSVHYERRLALYTAGFGRPPGGYHAEQWMVELDGQPAGYLLLTVPWDFVDQPELGIREVFEYAGSAIALAGGLAAALRQPGIREVRAPIAWQDSDLVRLLGRGGLRPQWSALTDHTFRIIDFPGLMAGLRPYLRARLEPRLLRGLRFEQSGPLLSTGGGRDVLAVARGKERLALDGAAMTRLVMGSSEGAEIPSSGAIKDIVEALFPLPSFLPGLNYH